jgi:hypothetical protein
MLRGKGQVRTQDHEDTRLVALTTAPLAHNLFYILSKLRLNVAKFGLNLN